MIPSDATLAWRALLGTYALHFKASANRTGSVNHMSSDRNRKEIGTDREPRVGFALGSLPSTEGAAPSSSLRRLLLSFSLSSIPAEAGRLLEPENDSCSVGGVLIVSEAWEEGGDRLGPNVSC